MPIWPSSNTRIGMEKKCNTPDVFVNGMPALGRRQKTIICLLIVPAWKYFWQLNILFLAEDRATTPWNISTWRLCVHVYVCVWYLQRLDARISCLEAAQNAYAKGRNDWAAKVNLADNYEINGCVLFKVYCWGLPSSLCTPPLQTYGYSTATAVWL